METLRPGRRYTGQVARIDGQTVTARVRRISSNRGNSVNKSRRHMAGYRKKVLRCLIIFCIRKIAFSTSGGEASVFSDAVLRNLDRAGISGWRLRTTAGPPQGGRLMRWLPLCGRRTLLCNSAPTESRDAHGLDRLGLRLRW